MRLNRFIATYSSLSRRKADALIEAGGVSINRKTAHTGMKVDDNDIVVVEGKRLMPVQRKITVVLLNKPEGFVCSRDGQGSPSVYDLLQQRMQDLNIAGRLDKDSSGLVVLTNDGQLQQELTHPSYNKEKIYIAQTDKPIAAADVKRLQEGVNIGDERLSKLNISRMPGGKLKVTIGEGRNRQIRRSFESVGHRVTTLHRIKLGPYSLGSLQTQQFKEI